jgi:hypothetical protein
METVAMRKYVHYIFIFAPAILSIQQLFATETKTSEWGAATNNVQMSIRVKSVPSDIKQSEPVKLLIRFRNISTNETFMLYRANSMEDNPDCSFVVLSPSGTDLWPSVQREVLSGASVFLQSGQVIEFEFDLSRRCRFDQIGTYKIIAKYGMWSREKRRTFQAVSNTLQVSITPGKRKAENESTNNMPNLR